MKLLVILVLLTAVVVAQETKWAPIPRSNTVPLFFSVAVSIVAYLILRSGWGRAESHRAEQAALGTISNSYYEPRRDWISNGFTLAGGILGAMWWGATSWIVLVRALEKATPTRGLMNLQASVAVGVLAGGMVGAAAGLVAGEIWERRHRRQRAMLGASD